MVSRCHVCERPLEHDHDPHAPEGHYGDDHYLVAMRNRIYVDACWSCWMKWPDAHKRWPAVGYGRPLEAEAVRNPLQRISLGDLCDLFGDAA